MSRLLASTPYFGHMSGSFLQAKVTWNNGLAILVPVAGRRKLFYPIYDRKATSSALRDTFVTTTHVRNPARAECSKRVGIAPVGNSSIFKTFRKKSADMTTTAFFCFHPVYKTILHCAKMGIVFHATVHQNKSACSVVCSQERLVLRKPKTEALYLLSFLFAFLRCFHTDY